MPRRHALAGAAWLAGLAALGGATAVARAQAPAPTTLPVLHRMVVGEATISPPSGAQLVIHQHRERAAIEWRSFDIGEHASVTFKQPGPASVTVNRVIGEQASHIQGALSANGQVFLLNEQGVVFGSTSRIDVGGLVVSTRQLRDDTWTSLEEERLREPGGGGGSGPIRVGGQVRVREGGVAILQGGRIHIDGHIRTPGGQVWVGGSDVHVGGGGHGMANLDVDAEDGSPAGRVDIRADASGVASPVVGGTQIADSAGTADPGGRVLLRSQVRGRQLTLGAQAWEIGAGDPPRRSDLPPDSEAYAPSRLKASQLSAWLDEGRSVHLSAAERIAVTRPIVTTGSAPEAGALSMTAPELLLHASIERAAGDLSLSVVERNGAVGALTMDAGTAIRMPGSRVSIQVPAREAIADNPPRRPDAAVEVAMLPESDVTLPTQERIDGQAPLPFVPEEPPGLGAVSSPAEGGEPSVAAGPLQEPVQARAPVRIEVSAQPKSIRRADPPERPRVPRSRVATAAPEAPPRTDAVEGRKAPSTCAHMPHEHRSPGRSCEGRWLEELQKPPAPSLTVNGGTRLDTEAEPAATGP